MVEQKKKVKLFIYENWGTSRQKEIPVYWEREKNMAFLKCWNTDKILRIRRHYG